MGDMGDIFNDMRKHKKETHARYKSENMRVIADSKIPCTVKDEVILFREHGKPKVDYYPSSNSWKHIKKPNNRMMYGNAVRFLNWYKKQ